MTQHLILMSVVPPLLLLGAPAVPLLRVAAALCASRWSWPSLPHAVAAPAVPLAHPSRLRMAGHEYRLPRLACPAAYELALRSPGWHEVEHACFLVTSLLFWFPVIQPWPSVSRGSRWAMLPYLVGADLVNTALSAFLTFSGRVIYPSYAAGPRVFGISALARPGRGRRADVGDRLHLLPCAAGGDRDPSALAAISPRLPPATLRQGSIAVPHARPALRPAAAAPDWPSVALRATAGWRCRASPLSPRSW